MDAGEQMHEQIARDAGSVVAVVAPAEEPNRLERTLRRAAEEAVPVDGLRRCVRGNRVLPGADRRVAVDPRLDHVELADRAAAIQVARLGVKDRADALAADLQNASRLPRGRDYAQPLVDLLHHGLLNVD